MKKRKNKSIFSRDLKKMFTLAIITIILIGWLVLFLSFDNKPNGKVLRVQSETGVLNSLGNFFQVILGVPLPYTTIQDAINAAANGDTIIVAAGNYDEIINLNKSVELRGANADIDPNTPRNPESIINTSIILNPITAAITIKTNNTVINGFMIVNLTKTAVTYSGKITNVTIKNNIFKELNSGGISINGNNIVIDKNIFGNFKGTGMGDSAITLGGINITITDNYLYNISYVAGTSASAMNPTGVTNILVSGNVLDSIGYSGINIGSAYNAIASNNILKNIRKSGITLSASRGNGTFRIINNTFYNNAAAYSYFNELTEWDYPAIRLYPQKWADVDFLITNNSVYNSWIGVFANNNLTWTNTSISIVYNSFYNSTLAGILYVTHTYNAPLNGILNVSYNWFGIGSGPSSGGYFNRSAPESPGGWRVHPGIIKDNATGIDAIGNGEKIILSVYGSEVIFYPWLCKPHDQNPDTNIISMYQDSDGDSYGNAVIGTFLACSNTPGYTLDNTDCNDLDANAHPGASEVCGNGIDEDCDGSDSICPQIPSGGGGSSSTGSDCFTNWSCGEWGSCQNGKQTRICKKINDICLVKEQKPEETKSCEVEIPSSEIETGQDILKNETPIIEEKEKKGFCWICLLIIILIILLTIATIYYFSKNK